MHVSPDAECHAAATVRCVLFETAKRASLNFHNLHVIPRKNGNHADVISEKARTTQPGQCKQQDVRSRLQRQHNEGNGGNMMGRSGLPCLKSMPSLHRSPPQICRDVGRAKLGLEPPGAKDTGERACPELPGAPRSPARQLHDNDLAGGIAQQASTSRETSLASSPIRVVPAAVPTIGPPSTLKHQLALGIPRVQGARWILLGLRLLSLAGNAASKTGSAPLLRPCLLHRRIAGVLQRTHRE